LTKPDNFRVERRIAIKAPAGKDFSADQRFSCLARVVSVGGKRPGDETHPQRLAERQRRGLCLGRQQERRQR
jgi:hypothetical protein